MVRIVCYGINSKNEWSVAIALIIYVECCTVLLRNWIRGGERMQQVYFYFDDSGVLHKNAPCKYFVYAGYVFSDKKKMENAKRIYRSVNLQIKEGKGIQGELKAAHLKNSNKNALFACIKNEDSVGLSVLIPRVYDHILCNKKSIYRYKDYVLKRIVKSKLSQMIYEGTIDPNQDIDIKIYVDEQATATDGFYSLRDSIYEEIKKGISNFDYGTFREPLFHSEVIVSVEYCDSSRHYLIQASDILANRIYSSFVQNKPSLREIPNHHCVHFPG